MFVLFRHDKVPSITENSAIGREYAKDTVLNTAVSSSEPARNCILENSFGEIGATKIGLLKIGAAEISATKIGSS